ncbi:MAG: Gfo/Idh/MocA family oxidoreductase [Acidobacteria bacterium]|nr:Gfo/Idh/MocA family oxidoreductase [Acidobacteriota bacterium]
MVRSTRRDFAAAAAAFTVLKPQTALGFPANSALSVGLIGAGRRGVAVSGIFAAHEFARIGALCDIYDDQLQAAAQKFSGARLYRNLNELLASDVDAVLIATPPYLHPEHFEAAVKARKHIFLEKPAAVDAAGCRRVIEAARRADPTKRISVGYQQRYGKDYRRAFELVKSGELGAIKMVRAAWLGGGLPRRSGHAASEEQVRNWLFYREKSGDILVEQNCHNLDVVNWFAGTHPIKACGYGGRAVRTDIGNIMDNLAVTFQFAGGLNFSYSANQFSTGGFSDVSETFVCERGAITTSRRGYKLYRSPDRNAPPEEVATDYDITRDAVDLFIAGARSGQIENAAFPAAESTLTAIMAREAIYAGREMTWEQISRS